MIPRVRRTESKAARGVAFLRYNAMVIVEDLIDGYVDLQVLIGDVVIYVVVELLRLVLA